MVFEVVVLSNAEIALRQRQLEEHTQARDHAVPHDALHDSIKHIRGMSIPHFDGFCGEVTNLLLHVRHRAKDKPYPYYVDIHQSNVKAFFEETLLEFTLDRELDQPKDAELNRRLEIAWREMIETEVILNIRRSRSRFKATRIMKLSRDDRLKATGFGGHLAQRDAAAFTEDLHECISMNDQKLTDEKVPRQGYRMARLPAPRDYPLRAIEPSKSAAPPGMSSKRGPFKSPFKENGLPYSFLENDYQPLHKPLTTDDRKEARKSGWCSPGRVPAPSYMKEEDRDPESARTPRIKRNTLSMRFEQCKKMAKDKNYTMGTLYTGKQVVRVAAWKPFGRAIRKKTTG